MFYRPNIWIYLNLPRLRFPTRLIDYCLWLIWTINRNAWTPVIETGPWTKIQHARTVWTEDIFFYIKKTFVTKSKQTALFFTSKLTDLSCVWVWAETARLLWYVRSSRDQSGRADERECLTMEKSRQLLWQGKRGELILVPLHQAHLLPETHKTSSHYTPTRIQPSQCQCVTASNAASSNDAWREGLEATRGGVTHHKRLSKMLNAYYKSFSLCVAKFFLPHTHTDNQATCTHPARRLLHVW